MPPRRVSASSCGAETAAIKSSLIPLSRPSDTANRRRFPSGGSGSFALVAEAERSIWSSLEPSSVRKYNSERPRRRPSALSASANPPLPLVLNSCIGDGLPLEVRDRVRSATGERHDVILPVAGADAARLSGPRAGMLALEFPRHLTRSVFSR